MAQVLHFTKRPVIYVDTEKDNLIPFSPKYVDIYISFVAFFVRPISVMTKKLGYKKAIPYLNDYLSFLTSIYSNAASIYRFCLTTTVRPRYLKNKAFITIHIFDPHLLCVPSIHVAIGTGVYEWYKDFFNKNLFTEQEADFYLNQIKSLGFSIIESVLFVKQHSINCIPLALYMLTATNKDDFIPKDEVHSIISELFINNEDITEDTKDKLRNHFISLYDNALENRKNYETWQESITNWLVEHAKKTSQKI